MKNIKIIKKFNSNIFISLLYFPKISAKKHTQNRVEGPKKLTKLTKLSIFSFIFLPFKINVPYYSKKRNICQVKILYFVVKL